MDLYETSLEYCKVPDDVNLSKILYDSLLLKGTEIRVTTFRTFFWIFVTGFFVLVALYTWIQNHEKQINYSSCMRSKILFTLNFCNLSNIQYFVFIFWLLNIASTVFHKPKEIDVTFEKKCNANERNWNTHVYKV